MTHFRQMRSVLLAVFLGLMFIGPVSQSHADDEVVYFSVQSGSIVNAALSDIKNVGGSYESGTTATDLKLSRNSLMYGVKAGIYSRRGLLALEGEYFRTSPDIKKQNVTFSEPSYGPYRTKESADVTIDTLAINVIGRVPVSDRMVVYAGGGPAYLRGTFRDNMDTPRSREQSSNRLGINALAGVNYFINKYVGLFAEWKFNHAKFKVPDKDFEQGYHAKYNAHMVAFGIGYYFDLSLPVRLPWTLRSVLGLPEGRQLPLAEQGNTEKTPRAAP